MTTTIKAHRLKADLLRDSPIKDNRVRVSPRQTNYLSTDVRPSPTPFDDDGPGQLSRLGPRHDNDHINIRDIEILPTTDEILAVNRKPYIPRKNLHESHFLESPMPRLLDVQFRQLRFDHTEYLRDVCYTAAQKLVSQDLFSFPDYEAKEETTAGNPFFLFRDARFEEIIGHERKGLTLRVSFSCPEYLRGRRIMKSGRFQNGMLCALIGIDKEDEDLSVTFMEITQIESTHSMNTRGGKGLRAAVQLSFAQQDDYHIVFRLLRYAQRLATGTFVLVEFPGALYAGFYWCLKRLQGMDVHDIAFSNYIAPHISERVRRTQHRTLGAQQEPLILPPAYTTRDDFSLDLSRITNKDIRFPASTLQTRSRPLLLDFLRRETTLDDGQATAFADSLSREFAFTQGPPGTGKTYLGITLARTILASRVTQAPKPIIVVCLTNHALDSFLEGLINVGETNIVRIGRGSREEWAKKYTLFNINKKTRFNESDKTERADALLRIRSIGNEIRVLSKDLNEAKFEGVLHWHAVKTFLKRHHRQIYEQLTTTTETVAAQSFAFDYWAGGGDLENLADLKKELETYMQTDQTHAQTDKDKADVDQVLKKTIKHVEETSILSEDENVWNLSLAARKWLLDIWKSQIDQDMLVRQLVDLHFDLHRANLRYKGIRQRLDKESLLKQDIIGLTTTACASNWWLLKSINPEVIICEEAAEVMEAHTLCTLFPSIEHAIFIGDPLQLRPEVQEHSLSLETNIGMQYRLDESLFERCMLPRDPNLDPVPISQLSVQRRMHPEIAAITNLTYPNLTNHAQTLDNPLPVGIYPRIYWLDHEHPETSPSESVRSYLNTYEVDMVVAFVQYLLRLNGYSLGQVAVLTPYNGQLAALKKGLQSMCSVWLSEKDRLALIEDGLLEEKDVDKAGDKDDVQMSDMLRIATIDNFQGEEARIVILSTVRSGNGLGFLKTHNRVNVACSRARDGFYIIGNSKTLRSDTMWHSIVSMFTANACIGNALQTSPMSNYVQCHVIKSSSADTFAKRHVIQPVCTKFSSAAKHATTGWIAVTCVANCVLRTAANVLSRSDRENFHVATLSRLTAQAPSRTASKFSRKSNFLVVIFEPFIAQNSMRFCCVRMHAKLSYLADMNALELVLTARIRDIHHAPPYVEGFCNAVMNAEVNVTSRMGPIRLVLHVNSLVKDPAHMDDAKMLAA